MTTVSLPCDQNGARKLNMSRNRLGMHLESGRGWKGDGRVAHAEQKTGTLPSHGDKDKVESMLNILRQHHIVTVTAASASVFRPDLSYLHPGPTPLLFPN